MEETFALPEGVVVRVPISAVDIQDAELKNRVNQLRGQLLEVGTFGHDDTALVEEPRPRMRLVDVTEPISSNYVTFLRNEDADDAFLQWRNLAPTADFLKRLAYCLIATNSRDGKADESCEEAVDLLLKASAELNKRDAAFMNARLNQLKCLLKRVKANREARFQPATKDVTESTDAL